MADEITSPSHPETGASVYSELPPEKKYSPADRRKRRRNLIILIAAVVVAVGGLVLWRYFSSYESTDDAQADVHLYPVSARVSGYVIRVNVNDNQWVNKNDVLVEIDPTDYQVALPQAQQRSNLPLHINRWRPLKRTMLRPRTISADTNSLSINAKCHSRSMTKR